MQRRGGYIAIEGPIGVGKTSLARALAKELNARLVLEGVEDNPFLARFYEDPDQYALPVQLYFLLTRYNQQRELAQQDLFAQATVADYLFGKDRIFAALNLAPDEIALYDNVYRLLDAQMPRPDLVVYIRANVEVLIDGGPAEEDPSSARLIELLRSRGARVVRLPNGDLFEPGPRAIRALPDLERALHGVR